MTEYQKIDPTLLIKGLRGLEREGLRLNPAGQLSQQSHESVLGLSANDPVFTLDFAECQLELVTPPFANLPDLMAYLAHTAEHLTQKLKPETLWPYSMPPRATAADIKIADFGHSDDALKKLTYRKGLCHRYGKMMQTICGIHYNFSFHDDFFIALGQTKNQAYFKMIRNFWRHYPILLYLFGASPYCFENSRKPHLNDQAFLQPLQNQLYIGPDATSLWQSELGYHNPDVADLRICFKNLDTYIDSLHKATSTEYAPYRSFPSDQQLNAYYLQIENEYYAPIRPKPNPKCKMRPIEALKHGGIQYIEVRILDLNPLLPLGIDIDTLAFIDLFLLYCLFSEDQPFAFEKYKSRALDIAKFGRKDAHIAEEGIAILKDMQRLLQHLQAPLYEHAWHTQWTKLHDPSTLPSARILANMQVEV